MSLKKMFALAGLTSAFLSPGVQAAESTDNTRWESDNQAVRTRASDTRLYYDAGQVAREAGVVRLKLYASEKMSDQRVVEEVAINCDTHEMSKTPAGGKSSEPAKLFAGEALYGTARDLCGWGAGFWKRLAD